MNYRFKTISKIDAYGEKSNVIHLKFGRMQKRYNFTKSFIAKHPRFVEEYKKYFMGEKNLFGDPLVILKYIKDFNIPVHLYSNYYDEEFADVDAAIEWLIQEYTGDNRQELYNYDLNKQVYIGLDGEVAK